MEKPEWLIGNEKRFYDFISKLNEKDKICLISHVDLDGLSAAKIVNKVIDADEVRFYNYEELNAELVEDLKEKKFNTLIITDMCVYRTFVDLLKSFKVLIIDHHPPPEDFNSDCVVFMNGQKHCATYLSYYLFSKIQGISSLDWLVACACIADWTYFENKKWMAEVFEKYGDKFDFEGKIIRRSGKFWELQWKLNLAMIYFRKDLMRVYDSVGEEFGEIGDLGKYVGEVQGEIDEAIERFEKEKEEISGRIFWEFSPKFKVGSIVSSLVSSRMEHKTVIIGRPNGDVYSFSVRRQDKKENAGLFLKKLVEGFEGADGGGHVAEGGGHVLLKDKERLKEKLRKFLTVVN